MRKLTYGILSAIAVLVALTSCSGGNARSDKPVLMVSIEPQRQILEQIAGDDYLVKTMLAKGSDPETFDPSAAERAAADRADIYFSTGVLPFEHKLQHNISAAYVDTSDGVDFIYGTHGHHHDEESDGHHHHGHGAADPHYWSSVAGARAIARSMTAALVRADADKADTFTRRYRSLMAHYDSLEQKLHTIAAAAAGRTFAVWHPSLSYFARDYGLRQLSLGQEGKEMSAIGLRQAIDRAAADSVTVFFFQQEYDSRQAETLCSSIGARLININPMAYDWEGQLLLIADEIARPQ